MKLTELEMETLLQIPMIYDLLLAKMKIENIGTDERRIDLAIHAERMRFDMGV